MSSLLQHRGRITKRGVGILGYLTKKESYGEPVEEYTCAKCGRKHPVLYEFFRKPRGMFGCWCIFHINGKEQVPDLSIPMWLPRVPRDATKLSTEKASKYWHSE